MNTESAEIDYKKMLEKYIRVATKEHPDNFLAYPEMYFDEKETKVIEDIYREICPWNDTYFID